MKKVIFTLLLSVLAMAAFSQSTYYWVGGTTGPWATATSWNTALNGSGTARASANTADVLIFDGSNIGGATPATGAVIPDIPGSYTIGQLKLQNAAVVTLQRNTTSTSSITIAGDGTAADDLTVSANSSLTVKTNSSGGGMIVFLGVLGAPATATINGTITIVDGGSGTARLVATNSNTLIFAAGSICNTNTSTASNYPFASSSNSPAAASNGVVFQAGATLVFQGGNSISGTTSGFNPVLFLQGSTLAMEAANPASGMFGSKTFANVIIRNNATITLADNFYNIDTLTVNAGSTFNMRITGTNPFSGDIINNGTFGAATGFTSNHLIMIGSVPQSIRGTGVFNPIGALSVGSDANVTLNTNITIGTASTTAPPTSNITGKLNTLTYNINSTGTTTPGGIGLRLAASATNVAGTLTQGSNTVTLNSTNFSASNVAVGALVSGTGIPANSYIIATNSGSFQFTISKAATVTTAADAAVLSIVTNVPTLTTSNPNGVDGSISSTGTRTFGAGSNYVFNAATTAPFSTSTNNTTGDVTFNAAATTNKTQNIGGTLTLNTGKLTIRSTDTLRLTTATTVGGAPFSSAKYIVTEENGANVGTLRMEGFTTAKLFPVGSATNYLPVTLTPVASDSFAVSVFEGITTDATPNGTAMSAAQKAKVVDAVWTINRTATANTGNCTVFLNWPASLEGSAFAGYGNNIGVGRYNSAWGVVGGSGDNTANTATNTFNAFSAFGVGQLGFALPVNLYNLSASEQQGKVKVQWNTEAEINVDAYGIERAADGINFSTISNVAATGIRQYAAMDNAPLTVNYYRIKVINKNGSVEYSAIVKVKLNSTKAEINVYPNPVKGNLVSLQLSNLEKGPANVKVYNNQGQLIATKNLNYAGGNQVESITLPSAIAKGMYRLVVTNNQNHLQQTIMVN